MQPQPYAMPASGQQPQQQFAYVHPQQGVQYGYAAAAGPQAYYYPQAVPANGGAAAAPYGYYAQPYPQQAQYHQQYPKYLDPQ